MIEIKIYKGTVLGKEIEGSIFYSCNQYYFRGDGNNIYSLDKVSNIEEIDVKKIEIKEGKAIYKNKRKNLIG